LGDNRNNRGLSKTKLYRKWMDMKSRCYNQNCCNYKYYGARGISVCNEWLGEEGFRNFSKWANENGYANELSIDRIDNDKNYSPDNCRWVTKRVQNINKNSTYKNTSGYIGIKRHSSGIGWYGNVKVNNKDLYTGYSEDIKEAVKMRNDFIKSHRLENKLNEVIVC